MATNQAPGHPLKVVFPSVFFAFAWVSVPEHCWLMKQLVAPGHVVVTGSPGRSFFPRSAGTRPVCFSALYRDCTTGDAYLVFTDGSTYLYNSPAIPDVGSIAGGLIHGVTFNAFWRRSLMRGGAFAKFAGSIPSTATLIYSNPPYAGADPGPCPPPCSISFLETLNQNCIYGRVFNPGYDSGYFVGEFNPPPALLDLTFTSPAPATWHIHCVSSLTAVPSLTIGGTVITFSVISGTYSTGDVTFFTNNCAGVDLVLVWTGSTPFDAAYIEWTTP